MKIHLTIFLFLIALGNLSAQNSTSTQEEPLMDDNEIYLLVDKAPEYPGGLSAFSKDFEAQFEPPLIEASIRKLVFVVRYVVEKDGQVSTIEIVRDYGYDIEQKVKTAFEQLKTWQPGSNKGQNVRVLMTLPLTVYPIIEESN